MRKVWWLGVVLGVGFSAHAAREVSPARAAILKQAEASMLLDGKIEVDAQGGVATYSIDTPDQVPAGVLQLVGQVVPKWRFQPVLDEAGAPVRAKSHMHVLIVARQPEPGRYEIGVRGATFSGTPDAAANDDQPKPHMTPPRYPERLMSEGIGGMVYLTLRVDHQGQVADVAVEQVNLRALGTPIEMGRWRRDFAEASTDAARHWRIPFPKTGPYAKADFYDVRVPIKYVMETLPKYGQWEPYLPGPHQDVPWLHTHDMDAWSVPDALAAGTVNPVIGTLQLLTPLDNG